MQTVTDRWYVIYSRILAALAVVLAVASLACLIVPSLKPISTQWDLSFVTLGISVLCLGYYFLFFKGQAERSGHWSASLIMMMFQTLNLINLMHATGRLHSWYLCLWALFVLAAGVFGTYSCVTMSFLITIYFVLISSDALGHTNFDLPSALVVIATYGLATLSWFIWKRFYMSQESQRVGELSKMLKSKQLQSEALIQAIADGVVVIDTDGKIILMNPAASTMTEWPTAEALGLNVRNVVVLNNDQGQPLDDQDNPFLKALQQLQPTNQTVNIVTRSGKTRVASLVISPVLIPNTQDLAATVAVLRDVTASRAEEKRSADFISTASHEMRTPVAAIEGYLALALNEHVSKIDPKARSYLEKAHASTEHLGQLFQDLLTSAKAEDGRIVSHPAVIEMGTYLEQLTDSLRFGAQKKGLLTDFTIGTAAAPAVGGGNRVVRPLYYVLADPDRMREVITNLFDNAVKYTETGKISIGLTGNDKVVQFYIRDTGHGIPKEDIPHLFQKFYRVDNSATRTIGGTGLGLFICRKIVELYNGRIWVDSEFDKGSTFYINLPRISSSKAVELQQKQAAGQALTIP
jgi:two-component system, OmpR family, sensor histidine kinase VicK